MLKIGINLALLISRVSLFAPKLKKQRAFTLVEVMLACVILSLGAVLVFESFFVLLDTYNYCYDYFNVAYLLDEKIWQAQDNLSRLGPAAQFATRGAGVIRKKDFLWELSYSLIDKTAGLYEIGLSFAWQEGKRKVRLFRTAYAIADNQN